MRQKRPFVLPYFDGESAVSSAKAKDEYESSTNDILCKFAHGFIMPYWRFHRHGFWKQKELSTVMSARTDINSQQTSSRYTTIPLMISLVKTIEFDRGAKSLKARSPCCRWILNSVSRKRNAECESIFHEEFANYVA